MCLQNAKGFTIDLLDYLGSQAQYLHSLMALQDHKGQDGKVNATVNPERMRNVEMALEALRNVIRNNPGESKAGEQSKETHLSACL